MADKLKQPEDGEAWNSVNSHRWCCDVQMCRVGCSMIMRPNKLSFRDFITFNSSNLLHFTHMQ